MNKYLKLLAQVVATIGAAVFAVWTDGITTQEWINVAIAAVTAFGVFQAPNVPGAKYTKVILAAAGAVLVFLVTAISGGIDAAELYQILVIILGAVGVGVLPNKDVNGVNLSETGSVGTV